MRVVAGKLRGFGLKSPMGVATRPTSDKVRGAIFDVLGDLVREARVVDLYAGTGAMAIEALSRGAATAVLVESRREACTVIRANLEKTGLHDLAEIWCIPVLRALDRLTETFDLIILDPPYATEDINDIMERLGSHPVLPPGGQVVLEHSKRFDSGEAYGPLLTRLETRNYGDTSVSFYEAASRKEGSVSDSSIAL